jgi:hypothetical protein
MALTARQAATLFFGTSLFGLLTFTSGLMIGVGIGGNAALPRLDDGAAPSAAGTAPPGTAQPPAAHRVAAAVPAAAGPTVVVPMPKPAPLAAGANSAPAVAASAAVQGGAAAAPATLAGTPVALAVKDYRVGLPLQVTPASPLRGPLVDAALAAPRTLTVPTAPAPSAAGAPAAPVSTARVPPAGMPAAAVAPPFVFAVQVGSFLVKANADRLAAELNARGYAAQVLMAQEPGGPAWYPVVLAPVHDVASVAELAQEFSASEGRNAEVVSWLAAK